MSAPKKKQTPDFSKGLLGNLNIVPDQHPVRSVVEEIPGTPRRVLTNASKLLRAFGGTKDWALVVCPPLSVHLEIHDASGRFASLLHGPKISRSALFDTFNDETQVVSVEEAREALRSRVELPRGEVVIVRFDLSVDEAAYLIRYRSEDEGPVTPEYLDTLKALSELMSHAAGNADMARDLQLQQQHLDAQEKEIREIQHFYRKFASAVRQCFWVLDQRTFTPLVVSENFERVYGFPPQILGDKGTGFLSVVAPEDRDRLTSEFHTATDFSLQTEFRVLAPDSGGEGFEIRWLWLRMFPMTTEWVVLIADDITEKKLEEESLRAREVEIASKAGTVAVGTMASGIAHEINNPLTIIVGKADEMINQLGKPNFDTERMKEIALKIQTTSVRISSIITSLKALSRNDASPRYEQTSFSKVVDDITDTLSEKFRISGVKLEIAPLPKKMAAEINPTMISQAILNLVTNAFDAIQNEREKWVKIDFAEDDESVFVYVTDSGPGIPLKIRGRIFDPFFTTKDPDKGTGLGLALCSRIAIHHSGTLRLDHLNAHTSFVLQLPKKQQRPQGSGGK